MRGEAPTGARVDRRGPIARYPYAARQHFRCASAARMFAKPPTEILFMNGRIRRTAVLLFVLFATFSAASQSAPPLQIELNTPHRSVADGGSVTLIATLRNTKANGRVAIGRLPDFSAAGSLRLFVLTSDGQRRPIAPIATSLTDSQALKPRQMHLEGGEALSVRRVVSASEIATAPGEYRLIVEFTPTQGEGRSTVSAPVAIRRLAR